MVTVNVRNIGNIDTPTLKSLLGIGEAILEQNPRKGQERSVTEAYLEQIRIELKKRGIK